jgi:arsenate reductase
VKYVLFVCTHNAGRSQMAQAFFERHAPPDIRAESAGQEPAERVWPEVVEAMREAEVDLSARRPKKLTVEMQLHADWAITLACGAQCPYVPTTVEDWDIPDPAGKPVEEVRAIRDAVEARVKDLIAHRLEAIRADRTAHQVRLERLLPDLFDEFHETRTDSEIRACADAILAPYQEVPVRSFVMTIAHRRARQCLAAETCHVLAS